MILDKFFLKYERGGGVQFDPPFLPLGKTTLKKTSLIRVKQFILYQSYNNDVRVLLQ